MRRYIPPKRRLTLNGPHGVISQKILLFTKSLLIILILLAIRVQEDLLAYFQGNSTPSEGTIADT
jgi:hypothetical protein